MVESESIEDGSSLFELTKFLGSGWKPISVETNRYREGSNVLQQTITLSYVKVDDPPEGEEDLNKRSNLQVRVFSEDR